MEEIVRELEEIKKALAQTNYSMNMLSSTISWLGHREPEEKNHGTCFLMAAASVCVIIASIINIAVQLTR